MKTIFIILADHFSIRNFLYSSFLDNDFKKDKIRIVFFLNKPENHSALANKHILFENIFVNNKRIFLNRLKNHLIFLLYDSLLYRFYKLNKFKNLEIKENIPKEYIVNEKEDCFRFLAKFPFSNSKMIFELYKFIYNSTYLSNKNLGQLFQKYQPQKIILSNPQTPAMHDFVIEAKKRNVEISSFVTSWDYPTTKGPVYQDIKNFYVWNKQMKDELKKFHKVKNKIHITGPLQTDYIFRNKLLNKKELFNFFNIQDYEKKLIVFGVYNERFGKHEPSLVKFIQENILEKQKAHLILRGHPNDKTFHKRYEFTNDSKNISLNQGYRFDYHNKNKNDDRLILNSLLKNATTVICGPTTLTLDAIMFGKPVINPAFDGDLKVPKAASIKERYEVEHYRPLFKYNVIYYAKNYQEFKESIKDSLKNSGKLSDDMKKIKDYYLEPIDGNASKRLYELIK